MLFRNNSNLREFLHFLCDSIISPFFLLLPVAHWGAGAPATKKRFLLKREWKIVGKQNSLITVNMYSEVQNFYYF